MPSRTSPGKNPPRGRGTPQRPALVHVTFDATRPETHLVRVTQRLPATDDDSRVLRMAAWMPGSYRIYDLARHVQDFGAAVAGRPAKWCREGKDAWRIEGTAGGAVEVTFDVYCRDLTVDTSHVTADHAHLFPVTLVLYDGASRPLPHRVTVRRPRGWSLWSGLETDALDGRLEDATDYDHLIDCPIELGPLDNHRVETFQVKGRTHRMVVHQSPTGVDWKRVVRDVRAICQKTCDVWGSIPYRHYTFIAHVAVGHGGGLEHRNSTVLGVDPVHLQSPDKRMTRFYPLVAHEFFHTWNVKRVLPAAFTPYALQQETYTDLLWLFEGITSYYELPILARARAVDEQGWTKVAAEMVEYLDMSAGRKRQSVAESSRLTWVLLYQPHEQNINRTVSYYTKGMWVGLCLDAALREAGVADGLDRVMRHMWEVHGRTGLGVPEDGFAQLVREATGVDVAARLRRWVDGTGELPLARSFRVLGWDLKREWKDPKQKLSLRINLRKGTQTIASIPDDAPAYTILQPEDELVAVDGHKWSDERFGELATGRVQGDEVELAVFREGALRTLRVPLATKPKDKVQLKPRKGDAVATRRRRAWLGGELVKPAADKKA